MFIESKSTCDTTYAKYDWRTAVLGTEIGLHHRIVRPLATGGMSQVFLAEHASDGSFAAAKLNSPGNEIPNELFDQEAALLARCRHPNVVSLLDRGLTYEGDAYILLELVPGIDLEEWLQRTRGPMSPILLLHVLGQLARAIDALHAQGVVHSDIKPANVMYDANARHGVKLIDFGLAFDRRNACTRRGSAGTPGYMAPEQLRGEVCGPAIDRFALAALGFELLTGKALQPWATLSSVRARAWARSAPFEARDPLSPSLERVFERALHDKPGLRYPSAATFVDALSGALEARGQHSAGTQLTAAAGV
jgi:serine/threonine protein kinase